MSETDQKAEVILFLKDNKSLFTSAAIGAMYFAFLSARWGTVESTAYFLTQSARFGVCVAVFAYVAKHLE